jgi:cytochrome c biogenesis protein CcmG/thiol:disulfide interchange protein DsbE
MTEPLTEPRPVDGPDDHSRATVRRASRTALWLAIGIGCAIALLVAVLATRRPAEARLADSPLLGQPAPPVTGTNVFDGSDIDLAAYEGKWVVLNFFSSWCVPCKQEHPQIERFAAAHADDAKVVAVIWSDSVAAAKEFFRENGGDWPVIADPGVKIGLDYGVRGPPESFVINPDGIVVAKYTGPLTAASLDEVLAGKRGS